MKKLLLLLLIPFVSFGQSFNDIKQIDSEKQFKRVMFENAYVPVEKGVFILTYALGYEASNNVAQVWAFFYRNIGKMEFQISKHYDGSPNERFTRILEQVKRECTFYDFHDDAGDEYICYTCPNSKYKGKIGFRRGDTGSDYIHTFTFD
jgi:hypothetical protein